MKPLSSKNAFSLVEMLIYVSVLSIIFLVVANTTISFTSSYRTLSALRAADHGGIDALETMTRTIRAATDIASIGTSLTLTQAANGISTSTQFYLLNGTLDASTTVNSVVNNSLSGPLTASNVTVTALTFTQLATSTAKAVKIDMTVQGVSGPVTQTKTFHSTVVLLGGHT